MADKRKILIIQFYIPEEESRLKELLTCLVKNIQNPLIDEIVMLNEAFYDFKKYGIRDDKLKQVDIGKRLSFKYAFEYCNKHYEDQICIVANSDIYYDETLNLLENLKKNDVYALTRYNLHKDGWQLFKTNNSQDSWIFIPKITLEGCDFNFGVIACDNRIAKIIDDAGYNLRNPSKDIRTYHVDFRHPTKKQWWNQKPVPGVRKNIASHHINE